MSLVSVVMGVYNGGEHLSETLDSILRQEGVDLELIVVDDGSTDATPRILGDQAADKRLRVLSQPNQGLTRALIRGCSEARGEFIARHDAADRSHPRRLAEQLRVLESDAGIAFVSCWSEFVGPGNEFLFVQKGSGFAQRPVSILPRQGTDLLDGPSCHASVVFRKAHYERAGGYRTAFYYGQDWDLWYRLAEIGTFVMIEQVLYTLRLSLGDISALRRPQQLLVAELSREALRLRRSGQSEAAVLERAAGITPAGGKASKRDAALYFIGECLRRNGDRRARGYLRRAIAANPLHLRAWIRLAQAALLRSPGG